MTNYGSRLKFLFNSIKILCVLVLIIIPLTNGTVAHARQTSFIRRVRIITSDDTNLKHPAGIVYSKRDNNFLAFENREQGQVPFEEMNAARLTLLGTRSGSVIPAVAASNPMNIAYDNRSERLLFLGGSSNILMEVQENKIDDFPQSPLIQGSLSQFGILDPKGMVVDPTTGNLYVLDAREPGVVRIHPGAGGSYQRAKFDTIHLGQIGLVSPQGLAFDPQTGHLYTLDTTNQNLFEISQDGSVVTALDLSQYELGNPQGLVIAPSGDQTDDPANMSLYLADSGAMNGQEGNIVEFSFVEPPQLAESNYVSALVRTTDLAAVSPPSPDSSGLTYIPSRNTLLMSDGEVEEKVGGITHFAGANVWELSLSGAVIRTANISKVPPTVVPMTNEPNGVALNTKTGHVYITEDDGRRVYDLNPGTDGLIGTADDTWTSFDTLASGSGDPEGIAFDSWNDTLFVADGLNEEIYQFTLTGSLINQFDVTVLGISDPESVEFNHDSGTLFIMNSNSSPKKIVETTTEGALIQTFDVSADQAIAQAGLAYAPASNGSTAMRFYIVDRGYDNNAYPDLIDGKMYEMTTPYVRAPGNTAPVVNAGLDQTISLPGTATLNGTAADDGLPNPPGAVTISWSKVSGPGTVTFSNPNAAGTTASFSTAGSYVLLLSVTDGSLTSTDGITITVQPANTAPVVDAGSDQAINLPGIVVLDGTVTDDGYPNPPGAVSTTWSKVSGPGTVTFGNPYVIDTTASFSISGSYVLRLTASDGGLAASDGVTIVANGAPTVSSGRNQTITWPDIAILDGTVADDGFPNPPGEMTTTWSKVSGPGSVTFGDASAVDTTASFSTVGSYVLRLSATDGSLASTGEVTITIHNAPVVDAGLDQIITWPETAVLDGAVADDGLPNPPGAVTITWSKVSGPGKVSFWNTHLAQTTANFSAAGRYVLRLAAYDGNLTTKDDVSITIHSAPNVDAGADLLIAWPGPAVLEGTVTDDGYPNPPGMVKATWSKVDGPGAVSFGDKNAVDTTASFSVSGKYVLRLTATDGNLTATDELTVTINQPPAAEAGADQIITWPGTVALDGTVSDDGFPNPPASLAINWSMVSGPGTVDFADIHASDTTAGFSVTGVYVLRLTVYDGHLTNTDDVTVTIHNAPMVSAGIDLMVDLPDTVVLDGTVTDDGLPNPPGVVKVTWSQVSGPGTASFGDPGSVDTKASFSQAGSYILRLTANDGNLTGTDEITINVNGAPVVSAGSDQIITLSTTAHLAGTETDDGLPDPPGVVTITWILVSGPGEVHFGNANAMVTTASFSVTGTYVLRLNATDGHLTTWDEVTIIVDPDPIYYLYLSAIFKK